MDCMVFKRVGTTVNFRQQWKPVTKWRQEDPYIMGIYESQEIAGLMKGLLTIFVPK